MNEDLTFKKIFLYSFIIFIFSVVFFYDYLIYGLLPITNADPSNFFWTYYRNSQLNNYLNFWDSSYGNGVSIFSNDIYASKFSFFSIFLSFFSNKIFGYVLLLWGYVFASGIIITYYLKKWFKLDFVFCLIAYSIFIFSPSFLNEYFFNGFGAFILLPLIFDQCNLYSKNNNILHPILAGIILVIVHFLSNLAIVQFFLIVTFFYLFYILINHSEKQKKYYTFFKFILIIFLIWLGLMSFYIFPFFYEGINSLRSHTSSTFFAGLKFYKIILYLTFPFTSKIFIDEQVIYTGLLTQLNSINGYIHFFYLPCLFIFFSNLKFFNKKEKFIIFYPLIFLFLGWINNYFPILSVFQYLTKSTGWWRSYPINILFVSFSIAIIFSKIIKREIIFEGLLFFLSKLILYLLFIFYFIGLFFLLYLLISYHYDIEGIEKIISYLTKRPFQNIRQYLDNYYFKYPVIILLFAILLSYIISLLIFIIILYNTDKNIFNKNIYIYSILFFVLVGQITINKLYYPFNAGIIKAENLAESKFISKIPESNLIAIIFNDENKIEKYVTSKNNLQSDITSLELELKLQNYPEFNRYQSNNTMFGAFFSKIGANVYTKGTSFTTERLTSFHQKLIKKDPAKINKFKNEKYYIQIGSPSINSNLIKVAGINYILSSLKINNSNYDHVFSGDYYNIYKSKIYSKNYYFGKNIFYIKDKKERLNFLDSDFFKINNDIVIEDDTLLDFNHNFKNLDSYEIKEIETFKIETNSSKENLFLIRKNFHPGWNIYVNNIKTKVYRANHMFMAILLPSGKNIITLKFEPPYFYLGLFISLITFLIIFSFFLFCLKNLKQNKIFNFFMKNN